MNHELKCWPEPFQAVLDGRKRHEIRQYDRSYCVGDTLLLREYDPEKKTYSGREVTAEVTYFSRGGEWGVPLGACVMSIVVRGAK